MLSGEAPLHQPECTVKRSRVASHSQRPNYAQCAEHTRDYGGARWRLTGIAPRAGIRDRPTGTCSAATENGSNSHTPPEVKSSAARKAIAVLRLAPIPRTSTSANSRERRRNSTLSQSAWRARGLRRLVAYLAWTCGRWAPGIVFRIWKAALQDAPHSARATAAGEFKNGSCVVRVRPAAGRGCPRINGRRTEKVQLCGWYNRPVAPNKELKAYATSQGPSTTSTSSASKASERRSICFTRIPASARKTGLRGIGGHMSPTEDPTMVYPQSNAKPRQSVRYSTNCGLADAK